MSQPAGRHLLCLPISSWSPASRALSSAQWAVPAAMVCGWDVDHVLGLRGRRWQGVGHQMHRISVSGYFRAGLETANLHS